MNIAKKKESMKQQNKARRNPEEILVYLGTMSPRRNKSSKIRNLHQKADKHTVVLFRCVCVCVTSSRIRSGVGMAFPNRRGLMPSIKGIGTTPPEVVCGGPLPGGAPRPKYLYQI